MVDRLLISIDWSISYGCREHEFIQEIRTNVKNQVLGILSSERGKYKDQFS